MDLKNRLYLAKSSSVFTPPVSMALMASVNLLNIVLTFMMEFDDMVTRYVIQQV